MAVSSREILVPLSEELVASLDEVARRRGVSRSELVRQGVVAVLEAEELAADDARLREAHSRQPQDAALVDAARRLAAENTPAW